MMAFYIWREHVCYLHLIQSFPITKVYNQAMKIMNHTIVLVYP